MTIPEWQYQVVRGIFNAILHTTYSVSSYGLENLEEIPKNQGFLMAANHGSIVDAIVMGLEVHTHQIRFVGRQKSLWSNPIMGKINDIIRTIPVPERKVKNKSQVIEASVNALKEGAAIGIYPEGAILPRRKSWQGKTGAVRIALEAGVPIVPAGLIGTEGLWPYGAKMPRLGRGVAMWVGKPLYFDEYHGMQDNHEVVRYITDVMMKEIRTLSGWHDVPPEIIVEMHKRYENLKKPEV